jgi:AcrR family transcriptional regulator
LAGVSEAALAPPAECHGASFRKLTPGPGRSAAEVADHQRARIHRAVVEITAERGYEGVAVREITRLASVSSRTFYKLFASKEECFLASHATIVRSVVRAIAVAQGGWTEWRDRLAATFAAFAGELERDASAARLLLVEAYAAGPKGLAQVRRAESTFEARIADCFSGERDLAMSPLLVRAMVSGMLGLGRSRLQEGGQQFHRLPEELTEWALSLCRTPAAEIAELDCSGADGLRVPGTGEAMPGEGAREPVGDRALIFDAVSKLVVSNGYERLAVPAICLAAGISRRRFHVHYADIDECFVDAAEARLDSALTEAEVAAAEGDSPGRSVQLALSSFCQAVGAGRALQRLGFAEVLYPGAGGLSVRDRAIDRIGSLIAQPGGDPAAAEASAAAIWGLLCHLAIECGPWNSARIDKAMAFLALAPVSVATSPGPSG